MRRDLVTIVVVEKHQVLHVLTMCL